MSNPHFTNVGDGDDQLALAEVRRELGVPVATRPHEDATQPLDLALRFGVLALECGGSVALAERAFASVLKAAAIDDGFAIWRLDSATAGRTQGGQVVTRPVGPLGLNLQRVSDISALADRVGRGAIAFDSLAGEIDRVAGVGSPYGPLTLIVAAALAAGLFARIQNGVWAGFLIAATAAAAGQAVRLRLTAARVPNPAMAFLAAVVSAMVAAAGLRLRMVDGAAGILIASVVYLIPGVALMNGFFNVALPRSLVFGLQVIASAVVVVVSLAVAVALAIAIMR